MPGMNGFETADLIRQRDRNRRTPIIFMTAMEKAETEMFKGYALGAIDYLVKPFVPAVLRSKVAVLIDIYRKTEEVVRLNVKISLRAEELDDLTFSLKRENEIRKQTERELYRSEEVLKNLNASLEARILERTATVEAHSLQLTRTNAELEQFVYSASHDLQEPLRTMTSFLQLIERRNYGKFDQESKGFFDFAVKCADNMRNLIKGLLEYSMVNLKEKQFQKVDCHSLVRRILDQLDGSISDSKAKIEITSLPEVYGEPLLLGQLFQNLIGNALKFCSGRPPQIEVGSEKREGDWLFWVKDNGIGVEPRFFQQIFRLFQRLHNREEYPGAGLGLAVCQKTVELHGGKIWCESELGQGSSFFFTIPFLKPVESSVDLENVSAIALKPAV